MQTLKTAAIVVLLMTVMYGAYVSMTTPPEPLPSEVEDMLVMDGEDTLAIDTGLPQSLESIDLSMGQPQPSPGNSLVDAAPDTNGSDLSLPAEIGAPVASGPVASTTGTFDAGSPNQLGVDPLGATPDMSAMDDSTSGVTTRLSDVSPPPNAMDIPIRAGIDGGTTAELSDIAAAPDAAANAVGAQPVYPSTNSTFELPDPGSISSSFNQPTPGTIHVPRNESSEKNLALASGTTGNVPPSASTISASNGRVNIGLANALRTADRQYAEDKRASALATLSIFYNAPDLSGEQRTDLLSRLDPLAREVIYSTQHLLEQPYRVGQGETLMDVAVRYEVPWQLLANINQIEDPVTVLPGTELKVVQGPFRAEVNLSSKELTLFLGDLYAGRFPIGIGNDPSPKPGTFTIQDKQTARTFYDANGTPVPAGSPNNPYGDYWLDLGGQMCIHGSPSTTSPTDSGCISLAADYADDLYGILSQGSSVTIRR